MLNNSTSITYIFFVKSKTLKNILISRKKKIYTFIITMNKIGFQTWQNFRLLPKTKKSFTKMVCNHIVQMQFLITCLNNITKTIGFLFLIFCCSVPMIRKRNTRILFQLLNPVLFTIQNFL